MTAIRRIVHDGQEAYVLDAKGARLVKEDFSEAPEVAWAHDPANKGRIYQGPVMVEQRGPYKVPFMTMAIPVYLESVDPSHPKAPGDLGGVLAFKIDLSVFTAKSCAGIRSGRTGYCWVIDKDGVFLYHPEPEFVGDDAFTARGRRNPAISFDAI